MEAHNNAEWEGVKVIVVTVNLHAQEGAYEINSLEVEVPRCERLRAWQDFIDSVTELQKVCIILSSVMHRLVQSLECLLQTVVGEISTVIGYESLGSITARECL